MVEFNIDRTCIQNNLSRKAPRDYFRQAAIQTYYRVVINSKVKLFRQITIVETFAVSLALIGFLRIIRLTHKHDRM